jgi:hypothetical protein
MRWARVGLSILVFFVVLRLVPRAVCARDAGALFDGDRMAQEQLAAGVAAWLSSDLSHAAFDTGSRRFDGEWLFGTHMMAVMGLGQVAHEHPETAAPNATAIDRAIDGMLSPEGGAFDREAWGEDALASLRSGNTSGHAAYLGYLGMALGMHRLVDPRSRWSALDDDVAAALARRLDASPTALLETYPREAYPVDNAAVIAAIALRDHTAREDTHARAIARALERLKSDHVDPATGLLTQSAGGPPRGSGTLLAVYFLAYADPAFSASLWRAAVRALEDSVLGFGVMREYRGVGHGDIDSGPIVLGYGFSATGFALAGARVHGDRDRYAHLYATAYLFGAPIYAKGQRRFVTGGPLGDAILLAMLTAPRGGGA